MANFSAKVSGLLGATLPWSFGMHFSGAMTEGSLSTTFNTAIATLFNTATNGLQNFMSADVVANLTTVSTLNATMHQTTKTTATLSNTGTDANASLPWNTSEIVTLRTAQATKFGHGRINLPPFAEDQIAAHVIKSATITSMITVFNAFFATMVGAGATPFLYNGKTRKDGTAPYTVTNVTGYDIPNKPAQQRRRVSKLVPTRSVGTL